MPDPQYGEPQPTLAYLMTDVVESTRLWADRNRDMLGCVERLEFLCQTSITESNGELHRARGEGDSHFAVFGSAENAVAAATSLFVAIKKDPLLQGIMLRAAVHAGSSIWAGDYYGPTVNRCARIRQAAHPGQILISEAACVLAREHGELSVKDLGLHRLRDLLEPERLFQVLHPELPAHFSAPETLTSLSHNLPSFPTSFIGRDHEIDTLTILLRSNRLITVTGAGGIGKTRLTLQVAAECVETFKDGAWFVNLAQTERAESVLPILCEELHVPGEASESKLLEALEHRRMLMILDNCEHLFEVCSDLAAKLLRQCPNVRILATSRRVMNVPGEVVFKVGGLRLPGLDEMSEAYQFDGFRLFVERANQRGTGLVVNAGTIPSMVDLCARLDGMPLAIEIMADHTHVLSVKEISRSFGDCLEMLAGYASDDPRQRTVAAAIESSRRLLSAEACSLLERVAFFPNTWTLEAAHQVCLEGSPRFHAIELVTELVNLSLVYSKHTLRDDLRFGLLQTTREVVAKGTGLLSELSIPYVAYCRKTIEAARRAIESGEEQRAHELVDLEWETFIKALEISFESWPHECVAIALALRPFWMRGTRMHEGRAWYEKLSRDERLDRETLVAIQIALSSLYILLGENDKALKVLFAAEETVRPIGGYELGMVIGNLAVVHDRTENYEEAKLSFAQCCDLFRDCGAMHNLARSLLNLGVAKMRLEEPLSECAELFQEALDCARSIGSTAMQANAHSSLAHLGLKSGQALTAIEQYRQALHLWQADLNLPDCALVMLDLAELFASVDRFEASARAVHFAERLEELSNSPFPSQHMARLKCSREAAKPRLSLADWRVAQRVTKGKSAGEVITMAIQLLDDCVVS